MISVDQQWIRWMNNGFRGWAMDNGLTMDLLNDQWIQYMNNELRRWMISRWTMDWADEQ